MSKKKKLIRKQYCIYLSDQEVEMIKCLVERVSPEDNNKPLGQIIRRGILALATNPDLDFVFDPGVCLKMSPSEIELREKLYACMRENIEILKRHGVELPEIATGGDADESKYEIT